MGGNALKRCVTRRYDADEYHRLVPGLLQELRQVLGVRCEEIPSYTNKPSFGDCDILVESDRLPSDWVECVKTAFMIRDNECETNSNVFSFARRQLQVDLICTPVDEFESSLQYFAHNDLGNLLGRMMHKLGIKYGHRGLSLVVRAPDQSGHVLKEIMLETDRVKQVVCDILGVDEHARFDELDDIFRHVASSQFFDPNIFLLDNRNHTSRTRDRKRKTYGEFLKWVEVVQPERRHEFAQRTEHGGYGIREPYYTSIVLARWPWVAQEVASVMRKYELNQKFGLVYNGNIVSQITGLTGKPLGEFMASMKDVTQDEKTRMLWITHPSDATRAIHSQWLRTKDQF